MSGLPLYGTVTILLYAKDVPGKLPDEQAEAKEWEFQRIKSKIEELLGPLHLLLNWEWEVAG